MNKFNIFLLEMTHLRYFIPLVVEGNKRGIKSSFFVGKTGKYSSPHKYVDCLKNLSEKYMFDICPAKDIKNTRADVVFCIEGTLLTRHAELVNSEQKIYSISTMRDTFAHHKNYINKKQLIGAFLLSEDFAERYDIKHEKNLYLGSPKYDISFNNEEICKKYNLNLNKRKAFVILPRVRDVHKVDFKILYESLRSLEFDIITKTRGKDPYLQQYACGDYHFMDFSWYPHDSMELMYASDIVINFSSTAVKECVLLKKPLINFHIKPFKRPLDMLYNYDYCVELGNNFVSNKIEDAANFLLKTDLDDSFNKSIENHLFTGNSSKRILDYLEQK